MVSINGGKWLNPFADADWEVVANLMEQADHAQIYVPTDYARHEMAAAHFRDLREFVKKSMKALNQQKSRTRTF